MDQIATAFRKVAENVGTLKEREGELSQTPSAEYDVRFFKVSRISPDPMVQILKEPNMESKGHKYNSFLRRFRLKVKPSSKVYGKKDRRQNRNAHKGDDL